MLEKIFPGEELKIGIIDPSLAHAFVGQPVNVLEQQEPDRKARLDSGPPLLAVERRDLAIDPVPVCFFGRIVPSDATKESCFAPQGNPEIENCRVLRPQTPKPCN